MTKSESATPANERTAAKPVAMPEGDPSGDWTLPQLRTWARMGGVDLTGLRLKSDVLLAVLGRLDEGEPDDGSLYAATEKSIAKAVVEHILDADLHAGPIATLLILARKIDQESARWEYAFAYMAENGIKAKPPPIDNVSIPTYRNYCESLGLTVGVKAVPAKGGATGGEDKPRSKLVGLRSQYAGA